MKKRTVGQNLQVPLASNKYQYVYLAVTYLKKNREIAVSLESFPHMYKYFWQWKYFYISYF